MRLILTIKKHYLKIALLLLIAAPLGVQAGVTDAASFFTQAGDQSATAETGFIKFLGFIGIIIFAVSGAKLFNSRDNQQEGKGKLWTAFCLGIFFMGIYTFAAITSNTLTGQTQSASDIRTVIKGSQ
ncbi:hypothetical protein [Pseudoalteromonas prydzensis]|uniref:hypothetical protein n=1 Tax=Pseudoalteromonas prydzensis TaxID=182141 RepID=UPI003FD126C8